MPCGHHSGAIRKVADDYQALSWSLSRVLRDISREFVNVNDDFCALSGKVDDHISKENLRETQPLSPTSTSLT
jgi:hypothetical protein